MEPLPFTGTTKSGSQVVLEALWSYPGESTKLVGYIESTHRLLIWDLPTGQCLFQLPPDGDSLDLVVDDALKTGLQLITNYQYSLNSEGFVTFSQLGTGYVFLPPSVPDINNP
jgi:hypothetical protein